MAHRFLPVALLLAATFVPCVLAGRHLAAPASNHASPDQGTPVSTAIFDLGSWWEKYKQTHRPKPKRPSSKPSPKPSSSKPSPKPSSSKPSPSASPTTTIPANSFGSCPDAQAALDAHNAMRSRHGAKPLKWSTKLVSFAQGVSNTCAFQHSGGPYGENLAIGGGLNCAAAVRLWVAEESQYQGGFSAASGHYTQVVWKSTTEVGCAIKSCGQGNFVTCSYFPPGNVQGRFPENVS